ncbi:YebC/PmpR family DNA-binding transcriptional regulator [Candidatus Uhrbacteria bacterium]|nr:YebC/PmpR family DNA-binding transcriptional regulator [Candidatus Uhrbacteria bacterium]
MSRHSKWSKIKRQKGMADVAKGKVFTKLGKAITITARERGGDPGTNFGLRLAIDKAREANMPKDNIEKAIARGTGVGADVSMIEEVVYEGYLPGGAALMVSALTDSRNRTTSNIKHVLSKYGGNLGGMGSVSWMFEKKGVIKIKLESIANKGKETAEFELIDAGADDIKEEDGAVVVYIGADKLQSGREAIFALGYEIESAELEQVPKNLVKIEDEASRSGIENIFEALDEDEDVNDFYTNIE